MLEASKTTFYLSVKILPDPVNYNPANHLRHVWAAEMGRRFDHSMTLLTPFKLLKHLE